MKMLALKTALITKDSLSLSQLLSEDVTYGHTNALIQSKKEFNTRYCYYRTRL